MNVLQYIAAWVERNFWRKSIFRQTSSGATHAGLPVVLDAAGHIDASMINDGDVSHNSTGGLQGGTTDEYYHLTAARHTDLTDGGATTLHKHDHGGGDGLTDDDHTQYVLLAGRSGGQVAYGGTGSGDDLTLRTTSHATKGDIIIADDGGNVGIGAAPSAPLHVTKNVDNSASDPYSATAHLQLTNDDATNPGNFLTIKAYLSSGENAIQAFKRIADNSIAFLWGIRTSTSGGWAEWMRLQDGNVGIGRAPLGILDVWDGTSGHMIVTKTAVDSTPVEVLPDATGGMAEGAHVRSVVVRSGVSEMNSVSISPGATGVDIFNDATNVWQLQSPAAGSKQLLVVRSAGTGTANVTLDILWQ